jgi:ATP/maltotriose-dependent transcriptional regulator MalT
MGLVALRQGDHGTARGQLEESMGIFRNTGDRWHLAQALFNLSDVARSQGDMAAARALAAESVAIFRVVGDKWGLAQALHTLGDVAQYQGDYVWASELYSESVQKFREVGDKWGLAWSLNNLGEVARCQDDYELAGAWYDASLAIGRELGSKRFVALALHNLGYAALRGGALDQAAACFAESLTLFQEFGSREGIAWCLTGLAAVAAARARQEHGPEEIQPEAACFALCAAHLFGAAEALRDDIGALLWPADRAEHDRYVEGARMVLDTHLWETAWAEGRRIEPEQAIAYALDEHHSFGGVGSIVPQAPASPVCPPANPAELTSREVEVLRLIAEGASNRAIAAQLVISLHTVKRHVAHVLAKLDAASRTEAVARGRKLGIL